MGIEILKPFINGEYITSKTSKYMDVYDPSIGEVIAQAPCCTVDEVETAIAAAKAAFPKWSDTPCARRVEVLYKFRDLLIEHMDELTYMICRENGKNWEEAEGEVLKVKEPVEVACGAPSLMMGESLMNVTPGFDSTLYREPIGVFGGIVPFNFPAMIPMGWMMPMCIATGNTLVLKAASMTPMTSLRIAELLSQAGLPKGVVNIITCSRKEANLLLSHPDIRGISFVGSTEIGSNIYAQAAANGKRVQCLCEAKNHALVLDDVPIKRTAAGIINSSFGCAGERCMALPVIAVQEDIADELVSEILTQVKTKKIGPAYDKTTDLGPVVTVEHKKSIISWIEKGINEGANLILDGRNVVVPGYEKGFFVGHTIFDNVTPEMTIGQREIFGPVLCIKRVKDFEEGITLMNANPYGNGSVIFTQSGHYAREFVKRTHGGMVGVNVGIPVPAGMFPFAGHKLSFFGDLHVLGKDGLRFYTESKVVTTRWFDEEATKQIKVGTWDGTVQSK
ncbi:CoA-acylating methylmalonate-semialdehyde dehydrogenase [Tepidanaerobacter sp. EBM-49]|uniref:CoA-acylating methylmalonate-semialdehyde dehydrogenase n=1 Tax=Tepidanaerobacter sp. EBM-49 TaxID=1918504 RepID=UPI000A4B8984|nr:CoA-acylating methylmalonate-semialdehyde dehydrogenase [Tepidanaerobacter sp. EBM-49]